MTHKKSPFPHCGETDTAALHQTPNTKVLEMCLHITWFLQTAAIIFYCSMSVIAACHAVYLSPLTIVVLNSARSFCFSFVQLQMPKENTYLHLGEWQWCQISTASSCQASLYLKLKYDSLINTSLSWSFSPTALFQTSFEVCLPPPPRLKGVCVPEERRYCQHSLIILFSPTLQATKFRQTPGSRHLGWEQVNTCTNSRSRINGESQPF